MPVAAAAAAEPENVKVTQLPSDSMLVDPEEDALDALETIKGYVRADLSEEDSTLISDWPNLDEYILELCGQSLEHLAREPASLAGLCERFQSQLEDVSCGNYRALIESFECAGAVREGVADVRGRLDALVGALPRLAGATREFSKSVAAVQNERARQLRTSGEAARVLEILDMPRLMRALVRAELYDEALELREHGLKLRLLHPDEDLVQRVCGELDVLTQQMILQLLIVLRGAVALPVCLRIVGFLRRLDVFDCFRLRMIFLQCRGEWMRNSMDPGVGATPQARLVALSDGTRAMVFEIITQYRAVFSDDGVEDEGGLSGRKKATSAAAASSILHDWAASCIDAYLASLEEGLRDICDGAALNTVLQQAMYCGHSLGRVGADFRAALPPLFEAAVVRIYASHLAAARRHFETMLEDHRWAPVGSSAFRRGREDAGAEREKEKEKANGASEGGAEAAQYDPPLAVLDSPPLAVFLNGILAALNELRLCAPVSLGKRLGAMLEDTVVEAARFMSAIGGPGGVFLKRADRPHFVAMISSLRDLCLPHAARCLDYCMGQTKLARVDVVTKTLVDMFGDVSPMQVKERPVKRPVKAEERVEEAPGAPAENGVVEGGEEEEHSNAQMEEVGDVERDETDADAPNADMSVQDVPADEVVPQEDQAEHQGQDQAVDQTDEGEDDGTEEYVPSPPEPKEGSSDRRHKSSKGPILL